MPITFACSCGRSYTVADGLAGKKTKCPACRATLVVPEPITVVPEDEPVTIMPDDEPTDDGWEAVEDDRAAPKQTVIAVRPIGQEDDFEVIDDEPAARKPAKRELVVPPYFIALKLGGLSKRVYRVYRDAEEESLLFLDAGPYVGGWKQKSYSHVDNGGEAQESGLDKLINAYGAHKQMEAEVREKDLDAMKPADRRKEADAGQQGFRATADDLSGVTVDPPSFWKDGARPVEGCKAVLRFTHRTAGTFNLQFAALADARIAVHYLTELLGKGGVTVSVAAARAKKLKLKPGEG